MYKLSVLLLLLGCLAGQAQPDTKNFPVNTELRIEQIEGLPIGWWGGIKKYDKPAQGKTLNGRTYSAKQIDYSRKFVEWMQASYFPEGCQADAGYYQNRGLDKYRKFGILTAYYDESLPQLYGAYSKIYMFLKKDAKGNFAPAGNYAEHWQIAANQLEHISQMINCISTPAESYFIMPQYIKNQQGSFSKFADEASFLDFDKRPDLQPYQHYYIPPKIFGDLSWYVVILTKDNQPLPFETITIGEFLERLEKNLPVMYKDYYTDGYGKINAPKDAWDLALKNMALIKENYKNQWSREARLKENTQVSFISIQNATNGTLYWLDQKDNYTSFPVMRLKKGVLAACKTDQPQWIVIRWTLGMRNHAFNVHTMQSILNNFNFGYVQDYFFGKTKITEPYKPLRSPAYKEQQVTVPASQTLQASVTDKNILFFDDFSSVPDGTVSPGWNSNQVHGYKAKVKSLDNSPAKWLELANHEVHPKNINYPLPADIEISYELAVLKDFTWGTPAMHLYLCGSDVSQTAKKYWVDLRPGWGGRAGSLVAGGNIAEGYTGADCYRSNKNSSSYDEVPGFSNDKPVNKIEVRVRKQGETIQVFINNKKIYDCTKAIPGSFSIRNIRFTGGQDEVGYKNYYYLGNVKITRL